MIVPALCAGMGTDVSQKSPVAGCMLMTFRSDEMLVPHVSETPFKARNVSTTAAWTVTPSVSTGGDGMTEMFEIVGPPEPPEPIGVAATTTLSIEALGRAPDEPAGPVPL